MAIEAIRDLRLRSLPGDLVERQRTEVDSTVRRNREIAVSAPSLGP